MLGLGNPPHPLLSFIEENEMFEEKKPLGVISNAKKSSNISRDSPSTSSNSSPPQAESYTQTKDDQATIVTNSESSAILPLHHRDISNVLPNSTKLGVSGVCLFLARLLGSGLTLNSYVDPSLAAYSLNYLCSLLMFAVLTTFGSILPLAITFPKEKLRGPGMSQMSDMKNMSNMNRLTVMTSTTEMYDRADMTDIDTASIADTLGITGRQNRNKRHRRHDRHQRNGRLERNKYE
nr:uncharacterized protein LOC123766340 [Procambarus clarkii]